MVWFALGAGVTSLSVVLFLVLPHSEAIRQQLSISARNVYGAESPEARSRLVLFGWEGLGMTLNLFWEQSAILLLAAAALLIARLGKVLPRRPDLVELLCWAWILGGLLFLATQRYQPDRRFLFLMPPLAILAWQAVSDGALRIPARDEFRGPAGQGWPSILLGAFLGAALAFYAQAVLSREFFALLGLSPSPGTQGLGWGLDIECRAGDGGGYRPTGEAIVALLRAQAALVGLRGAVPACRSGSLHGVSRAANLRRAGRGKAPL